jgi:SAM-dependent methyltransferase
MSQAFFASNYVRAIESRYSDTETGALVDTVWKLGRIEAGSRVLDAGCGYGRVSIPLAIRGAMVTGADRSPQLLTEARHRTAGHAISNAEFIECDLRTNVPRSAFDVVLSLDTSLGYDGTAADLKLLSNLRSVTSPGGRIVVEQLNLAAVIRYLRDDLSAEFVLAGDDFMCIDYVSLDISSQVMSTRRIFVEADGTRFNSELCVRLYSIPELADLLCASGYGDVRCLGGDGGSPTAYNGSLFWVGCA